MRAGDDVVSAAEDIVRVEEYIVRAEGGYCKDEVMRGKV